MSRAQFEAAFPDDAARATYLFARRWPQGLVCSACGGAKAWELTGKRFTFKGAACGRQTSVTAGVTAGTVVHRSHLPLRTWFVAAHILASHSNGISALQLQAQLGLGSDKTAWLLLHKLRRAMVDPERRALAELVEVDETTLPLRGKEDPPAGGRGRSAEGKVQVAGAVELSPDGRPRRIRLSPIDDFSAASLRPFVGSVAAARYSKCRPLPTVRAVEPTTARK